MSQKTMGASQWKMEVTQTTVLTAFTGRPPSINQHPFMAGEKTANGELRANPVLREAAVLLPLIDRSNGIQILLTKRSQNLPHHKGQISFPGGLIGPQDPDPITAALRETEEEIGVPSEAVSVIGRLPEHCTATGFRIVPLVGFLDPAYSPLANPEEVSDIFEVPLSFFLNPGNRLLHASHKNWQPLMPRYAFRWQAHYIWGATAAILLTFGDLLLRMGNLSSEDREASSVPSGTGSGQPPAP